MKPIVLAGIFAAILLAACATKPPEPPPKPFAGTRWVAQLELPFAGEKPWVRFGDGRLEGFGGCNRFSGRYVEDSLGASAIGIGRIETGRRICDAAAHRVEEIWLDVLHSASSYSIAGDTMVMNGSGGTLRFRAAAEETKP